MNTLTERDKELVEHMFLEGTSVNKIAQILKVSHSVIAKYVSDEYLQELKESRTVSRVSLYRSARAQLGALNREVAKNNNMPNSDQTKMRAQLIKEIEVLAEMPLSACLEVLDDLNSFLAQTVSARELKALNVHLEKYLRYKSKV